MSRHRTRIITPVVLGLVLAIGNREAAASSEAAL